MVSRKTIARMSLYGGSSYRCATDGTSHVFSHQLAKLAGLTAAQVRRDFMSIGYSGSPTRGYEVGKCIDSIGGFLDGPRRQDVALVGAGKLGRSIISHFSGRRPKLAIVAAFDDDRPRRGPHRRLPLLSGRHHGVDRARPRHPDRHRGTPPAAAQKATDALVRAGRAQHRELRRHAVAGARGCLDHRHDITAALETAAYIARETPATTAAERKPTSTSPPPRCCASSTRCSPATRSSSTSWPAASAPRSSRATRVAATVEKIYAGDRVSDLLNEASDRTLLVTNLMSLQMIRVAELMDVPAICFVKRRRPEPDIVAKATAPAHAAGLADRCLRDLRPHLPVPRRRSGGRPRRARLTDLMEHVKYDIVGGDYSEAGAASRAIKAHLKPSGLAPTPSGAP